jgi:hypothetical protein
MNEPADLTAFAEDQLRKFGLNPSPESRAAILANLPVLFAMADQVEQALSPRAAGLPEFKL